MKIVVHKKFEQLICAAATLGAALLLILTFHIDPARGQSSDHVSDGSGPAVSKLSVSPSSLGYNLDLDKESSQSRHFAIVNQGTQALEVGVKPPMDPDYTISAPPELSPGGGEITIPGKANHSTANQVEIEVTFAPSKGGKDLNSAIRLDSDATEGENSAVVNLKGRASQKPQGLWVGGYQYISEFQGKALEQTGIPPANLAIGGDDFKNPISMTFDPDDNLWVAYNISIGNGPPFVAEISRTDLAALKTRKAIKPKIIAAEGSFPVSIAFDAMGDLWTSDQEKRAIVEFLPDQIKKSGGPAPNISLTAENWTSGTIRFDRANNLWVEGIQQPYDPSNPSQLWRFAPDQRTSSGTAAPGLKVNVPGVNFFVDFAFDYLGNIWLGGSGPNGDVLEMLSAADLAGTGEISPSASIVVTSPAFGAAQAGSCIGGIDFDHSGNLWVSTGPDNGDCEAPSQVIEFTHDQLAVGGSLTPSVTIGQNSAKTNLFLPGPLRFGPTL